MTDHPDKDALLLRKIAERIAQGIAAGHASVNGKPPGAGTAGQSGPAASPRITPASQHLAKLAHELKTPLSAIVAAAEIMRDERFGPIGDTRYQNYAAGIFDSAHHALGVINAMLGAPASPGAQWDAAASGELDLNALVEQAAASLRALLEAAGLTIECAVEAGLPMIAADAITVRQMVLNLVTNAMRATPAGGTVSIATARDAASVVLSVTDTGSGMTPGDIARALDPKREADFEQRPSGGLGLGYPLILNLAQLNGAHVEIESPPGRGTRVRIIFPADRVISMR